jgi:hypothetical protein
LGQRGSPNPLPRTGACVRWAGSVAKPTVVITHTTVRGSASTDNGLAHPLSRDLRFHCRSTALHRPNLDASTLIPTRVSDFH